jgi:hypothetical protein
VRGGAGFDKSFDKIYILEAICDCRRYASEYFRGPKTATKPAGNFRKGDKNYIRQVEIARLENTRGR